MKVELSEKMKGMVEEFWEKWFPQEALFCMEETKAAMMAGLSHIIEEAVRGHEKPQINLIRCKFCNKMHDDRIACPEYRRRMADEMGEPLDCEGIPGDSKKGKIDIK